MSELSLQQLSKHYGETAAVRDVTLSIASGEFAVLVGPSGCGKSTLLRAIAGLESIGAGDILLGGRSIRELPPRARNLAMVFQSYALYPYLSVFENIAFGLRARKVPPAEVTRRVHEAAERLALVDYLGRRPRELSGGQRQRVAIGRAIVRDAELFLFDEPLSNLDAKLRDEMREELKRLHQRLGKTFIYVTHDQIEAMTLADRIVLLREGRIEQSGTPLSLYHAPRTRFVADFLGSPAMNQLPVTACDVPPGVVLADGQRLALGRSRLQRLGAASKAIVLGVRPQDLHLADGAEADLRVIVSILQPTGSRLLATVMAGDTRLLADLPASARVAVGERIGLRADRERLHFFDAGTGERIDARERTGH